MGIAEAKKGVLASAPFRDPRFSTFYRANFMDVTLASRGTLWLKPDHIVIYDRVKTNTPGRFKRFHLQMRTTARRTLPQ